jgi:methionyl aminopeptidase
MKAAKEALEAARKALGVGVEVREIGKAIQEVIQGYGFSPVRNLSGHGLNPWIIHDVPTVPNFDNGDTTKLEEDQIVAIEPFATNGAGMIYELEKGNIFSLYERKPVRSPYARELLAFIEEEYEVLPFTTRWLVEKFGKGKTTFGLREMKQQGLLHSYPPLVEKGKGMVAVFEDSFLIGKEKVELLTKAD